MTIRKRSKFEYRGPVKSFDDILTSSWIGVTWAPSEAKALANLAYQYKIQRGLSPGYRINLSPDYLREVSAIEEDVGDGYEYYDKEWKEIFNESIQM